MSVSIISDVDTAPGNTSELIKEFRSTRAQAAAKPDAKKPDGEKKPDDVVTEPRRFAGKSREDIMEMYLNLESHTGRLANDLGRTQAAVQDLMVDKRARDLKANGELKPATVDPAELLSRPTEALDPFIEERVAKAVTPLQQQLSRMEQMLGATVFQNHHADAQEVTNSPEFKAWVTETPLRRSISAMAANGNTQAADELLTEYKKTKAAEAEELATSEESRLANATKVSLEQSRTGTDGAAPVTGKIYKRSEIVALMQTPAYENDEDLRLEVQKAYMQGRVK